MLTLNNWMSLLKRGFELETSGTTGTAKKIYQTPQKLAAANAVALEAQGITRHSRVLTVCSMKHAGGVLAQTLPALSIGAHVDIRPFNAYRFFRDVNGYSHTHLTPAHCVALMKTKAFINCKLSGLFVACGSENVSFEIIEAFVEHGAVFMCNWGMTEVGPIAINTVFSTVEQVNSYRSESVKDGTLMGDRYYCDYRLPDNALQVKGDICVYDGWFETHDRIQLNSSGAMYHMGRL